MFFNWRHKMKRYLSQNVKHEIGEIFPTNFYKTYLHIDALLEEQNFTSEFFIYEVEVDYKKGKMKITNELDYSVFDNQGGNLLENIINFFKKENLPYEIMKIWKIKNDDVLKKAINSDSWLIRNAVSTVGKKKYLDILKYDENPIVRETVRQQNHKNFDKEFEERFGKKWQLQLQ